MVVPVLAVVIVGVFVYRRFSRRRARRQAIKSAAMDRAVANPVDTTGHEDDVMIIASEAPPPYPAETPTPQSADPTVPEPEDLETYVRDKPPRYGSVVLQVQNA